MYPLQMVKWWYFVNLAMCVGLKVNNVEGEYISMHLHALTVAGHPSVCACVCVRVFGASM